MQRLSEPLHRWLDELLDGPVPEEQRATCSRCAMCDHGDPSAPESPFRPDLKCCTFQPELPNFLVGALLEATSTSAAAVEVIRRRIRGRVGVDPLALFPTPGYSALFESGLADSSSFGRQESILCPYFERNEGTCGVWAHRESVCATFFCRHNRGRFGQQFWTQTRDLLKAMEGTVRAWCIEQIDPGLVPTSTSRSSLPYPTRWGRWIGREEEFFIGCASVASSLSGADILAMAGPGLRARVRGLIEAKARLVSPEPPKQLRRGQGHVVQLGPTAHHCRVRYANQGLDYIDIPMTVLSQVADALDPDGHPTMARTPQLDAATLQRLLDFGVLDEEPM